MVCCGLLRLGGGVVRLVTEPPSLSLLLSLGLSCLDDGPARLCMLLPADFLCLGGGVVRLVTDPPSLSLPIASQSSAIVTELR